MKFERILKRQKFEIRNLRWLLPPFQPQCVCSALYRYWAALLSNEPVHSGCSCSYSDVRDSWDLVNCCLTTTTHCVCFSPPPRRNTLHQSANSRSPCSRTITWRTPPWYIGSSSRAGAGTSVWTRKEKSWRGTMSRRTSQQPTSSPNLSKVSLPRPSWGSGWVRTCHITCTPRRSKDQPSWWVTVGIETAFPPVLLSHLSTAGLQGVKWARMAIFLFYFGKLQN